MILHLDDVGRVLPINLLHIPPGLVSRCLQQGTAQLGRKTRLAAPDELLLLLRPRDVHSSDPVHHLIVRPEHVLRTVPRPETEIRHQPDSLLGGRPGEYPHGVIWVRDVLHLVLHREDELDILD